MSEERSALFVRIPSSHARQLDSAARALGRTKQDLVTGLLASFLLPASTSCESDEPAGADEVLTLDELAVWLKLDHDAVMARVMTGELPARRFGDQWRFSKAAVLGWLNGTDTQRPAVGFGPPQQHP